MKSGPGPKNGEQYGATFSEDDYKSPPPPEEGVGDIADNEHVAPLVEGGQVKQEPDISVEEVGVGSMISQRLGVGADSNSNMLEYTADTCGGQVSAFFLSYFSSWRGLAMSFVIQSFIIDILFLEFLVRVLMVLMGCTYAVSAEQHLTGDLI